LVGMGRPWWTARTLACWRAAWKRGC